MYMLTLISWLTEMIHKSYLLKCNSAAVIHEHLLLVILLCDPLDPCDPLVHV